MTWFRLDDNWDTHPKMRAAGLAGRGLFVTAGTYASRQLTDGWIDKPMMPILTAIAEVPAKTTTKLVDIGILEDHGDRYRVHDFLDFNPSRDQVLAERERWKRSKAKRRRESTEVSTVDTAEDAPVESPPSRPDPSPNPSSSSSTSPRAPAQPDDEITPVLRALADAKATHGSTKGEAWYRTVMAADRAEHGDTIARLVADHPGAPPVTIAARILGEHTPHLAHYRRATTDA